jgi:transketolase
MVEQNIEMGKANLEIFAETLQQLAEKDQNILVVTSDSRGSGKLTAFGEALPKQIVEIGIAEQNMVGISAGLASSGKKVFTVSPACFLTARALEQIKNDVAYSNNPVKVVGISAGVSYGSLGTTHHSIHDFAVLQAINNIDIVVPADNHETQEAIVAAVNYPRPLYIRFGKKSMPVKLPSLNSFEIGKASQLKPEKDHYRITFIANGETVYPSFLASNLLEQNNICCNVMSLHTIRPLDEQAIINAANHSDLLVTVEEHSVNGGIGSRIASLLLDERICTSLKIIGLPDDHTVAGSQEEIFGYYGISPQSLAETAKAALEVLEK